MFPSRRKIVQVSGCFWHGHRCGRCRIPVSRRDYWIAKITRNMERDRRTNRALRRAGWRILVVWECQTCAAKREQLSRRILRFLERD